MAFGFFVPLAQIFYTSVDGARLTAQSYAGLIDSRLFWLVLQNTFAISVESVLASLLLAYPIAYHLSRATPRRRAAYMVLVLLPFWTSILVKSFAFTVILGDHGIINNVLRALLGESAVLPLLFNRTGVVIGIAALAAAVHGVPDPGQPAGAGQRSALCGAGNGGQPHPHLPPGSHCH